MRMTCASLVNTSSTLSPESAETSTDTGTLEDEAHRDASSVDTSLPSVDTVAEFLAPRPVPAVEPTDPPEVKGNCEVFEVLLLTLELDGVGGGIGASIRDALAEAVPSEERSTLFPTSKTDNCGEAKARASLRKVGRALKDKCEAIS